MKTLSPITITEASTLAQIITLHGEIIIAARTSLDKAIVLGGLLIQEKERLGHGNWLPWLKSNVPFTDRTASNYIRLYDERGTIKSKSETVSDLKLCEALRILAAPRLDPRLNVLMSRTSFCGTTGQIKPAGHQPLDKHAREVKTQLVKEFDRLIEAAPSLDPDIKRDVAKIGISQRTFSDVPKVICSANGSAYSIFNTKEHLGYARHQMDPANCRSGLGFRDWLAKDDPRIFKKQLAKVQRAYLMLTEEYRNQFRQWLSEAAEVQHVRRRKFYGGGGI